MSEGIISRFAGTCPVCSKSYAEGDVVERVHPDSNQRGHLSCVRRGDVAQRPAPAAPRAASTSAPADVDPIRTVRNALAAALAVLDERLARG